LRFRQAGETMTAMRSVIRPQGHRETPRSRLVRASLRCYVRYAPTGAGKTVLAGRLLAGFRAFPETKVARTRSSARFAVATDDVLQGYLYLFGVWEPNITQWVRRTLRPGDTFIDVGTNVGYFAVLASRLVARHGRVVAIEASPEFTDATRENLALNNCANVRLVNAAVSDRSCVVPFYQPSPYNRGNTTSVRTEPATRPRFTVSAAALPEILTEHELGRARLVKIDVEGSEYAVVRGLIPALSRMRSDAELIVEISPELLAAQGYTADGLVGLLAEHGFNAYRIANGYCVSDYLSRAEPSPPRRWGSPVTELSDFVFSRRDVTSL
jgi:FkbM family methyltransferase